jgi:hypothetical protein
MSADASDATKTSAGRGQSRKPAAPPENSLSASRRSRRRPERAAAPSEDSAVRETVGASDVKRAGSSGKRTDTDPWTVPPAVRDRFVQDGNRFYFPDGLEAFRDRGRRLTTPSANTEVIGSLVEIARARGWSEVVVAGTEAFRGEAWRQARLAGLEVRGYRPSAEERVQLIRTIGRAREDARDPVETVSADSAAAVSVGTVSQDRPERIRGRLLEHGQDFYRHDAREPVSYFVRLETAEGKREIWGKDLKRAVSESLSQPKIGDEVVLQRTGRKAVTVRRPTKDDRGELREQPYATFRNRWTLETQEFFEQRSAAAQVVRDVSVRPQDAVRDRPELAGTYLDLRAAQLAGRVLSDPEDRRRFVHRVRLALARDIERGEPLQPVRLRDRGGRVQPREPRREDLAPQR